MQSLDRHRVYKRLETDTEFYARVLEKYPWYSAPWYRGLYYVKGDAFDDEVWETFKMQRRIVEDTTDPTDKR